MADSLVRLRIDSQEYDAKLKRATEGLTRYADECRKVGDTLEVVEQETLDYVKSLGQMDTASRTATGKLAEMKKTFTELSVQYKQLTDEEKQSPFGQALSESLAKLKQRCNDAKSQLNEVGRELNGTGGFAGALASKLTLNVDAFKLLEIGLKAGKAALDVAKDAFLASETNIDKWDSVCKGAETAYNQLLQSLNQGSWTNFFKNISDAYEAGVNLFNVLDRMGSVRANNQFAISESEARMADLRVQLRRAQNDKDTALADSLKQQILAIQESIKSLKQQNVDATRAAGVQSVETILNSSYRTTTGGRVAGRATVDKFIEDYGKQGQKVFDDAAKIVEELERKGTRTGSALQFLGTTSTGMSLGASTAAVQMFNIANLSEAEQNQYALAKAIKEQETALKEATAILIDSNQQRQALSQQEFQVTRWTGASGSGDGGGGRAAQQLTPMQEAQKKISDLTNEALNADDARLEVIKKEVAALNEQLKVYKDILNYANGVTPDLNKIVAGDRSAFETAQRRMFEASVGTPSLLDSLSYQTRKEITAGNAKTDTTTLHSILKDALQNGIDTTALNLAPISEQISNGINVPDEKWQSILDQYNELRMQIGEEPINIDFKTGNVKELKSDSKGLSDDFRSAASAIQSVGSALNSIEDPAAKVAGTIAQAIATIALGFAQATASPTTTASGVWGWIASATAGIATMFSTISAVKSATKGGFAEGGIVPGNYFSGDNLRTSDYGINSGELILSRSQQTAIASQLTAGEGDGRMRETYVRGETIYLALTNYMNRSGKSFKSWQ